MWRRGCSSVRGSLACLSSVTGCGESECAEQAAEELANSSVSVNFGHIVKILPVCVHKADFRVSYDRAQAKGKRVALI